MRRPLAASAIALSLGATLLGGVAQANDDHTSLRLQTSPAAPVRAAAPSARQALETAREVLGGDTAGAPVADRSATLALRDLYAARASLTGSARAQADQLLARPSAKKRSCGKHVCVHWTTSGTDGATKKWAKKTLRYMGTVWKREIGKLGFRAPLKDGRHGGSSKLDVYLQDLGSQGIYGYCAPEFRGKKPGTASGYCALDNDFATSQFGTKPVYALHVTAAHEFFHASQFAYDYREDAWLMEATATWMEEQVADSINDNRQYLPQSQLIKPTSPLDFFDDQGVEQYGQWIYFQYLQDRYGRNVVRKIWSKLPGRKHYSVSVLNHALKGSFAKQYAGFVAANMTPKKSYPEGKHWPKAYAASTPVDAGVRATGSATLDHLSSAGEHLAPGAGLKKRKWHLLVKMDGPKRATKPMLVVVWQGTKGKIHRYTVSTNKSGHAKKVVPFSSKNTKAVYFAAVNASTRYHCRQDSAFACAGVSKDDGKAFDVVIKTVTR